MDSRTGRVDKTAAACAHWDASVHDDANWQLRHGLKPATSEVSADGARVLSGVSDACEGFERIHSRKRLPLSGANMGAFSRVIRLAVGTLCVEIR